MKNLLNFLIKINKLKDIPRTGWVLREVGDPETIAEHTFRIAVTSWLLGEEKKINVERAIKIALFHDLCEVYAGDTTPFSYYTRLPKNKEKRKKVLMKWVRLSRKEKERRGKIKFEKEKKALLKLVKPLRPRLKNEIFSCWLDYEKGITKEGRFVRQVDKIETLVQAIEYFGSGRNTPAVGWWEEVEELAADPLLLDFLKIIQKRFYSRGFWWLGGKIYYKKRQRELKNILDFILEMGKLKRMPRLYWVIREVEKPETVAGHIFTVALMAWLFGGSKKYNMEKLLKMALCHEVSAVYTGDTTPYDKILPKEKKKKRELLKRWPRLSKKEKMKMFIRDFKKEKKAFEKLALRLKRPVKKEIIQLWKEYRTRSTPEGHFLSQLNALAVLLQALSYEEKHKGFSAAPIWEWVFEISDNPVNFKLMEEMKKKFY